MRIETERLILREMTQDDHEALYDVLADSEIMKYYAYAFGKMEVQNWIDRNIDRYQTLGFGLWAVCLKTTGEVIGDCGLTMQNIHGVIRPEIGYHIRRNCQRNGYAKEAAIAVRDWAFENTPFCRLYSYMPYKNMPSVNTAIAWGSHLIEEYEDEVNEITKVFALDRSEWEQSDH